jgi:hypothetical protein
MHGDGVVGMLYVVGVNIAVFTTLFVLSELAVHLIWPTAKRNGKSEFGENGAVANAGTSSITFPLCLPISGSMQAFYAICSFGATFTTTPSGMSSSRAISSPITKNVKFASEMIPRLSTFDRHSD